MKKLLKISAILLTLVLVAVIGLSLFVRSYLDSEKLKSIVIPMVEEATGREFGIEDIQASIFRGIVIKGIVLKEEDGKNDFVRADEFVLRFRLLPLIRKQVVIKEVQFISPYIRIIRKPDGLFNFSSMVAEKPEEQPAEPEETTEASGLPVSLVTEGISLKEARVEFHDEKGEIPDVSALCDIDMKVSLEKGLEDLDASGTVNLAELIVKAEGIEAITSGTVTLDRNEIVVNLKSTINDSNVEVSGSVKDYLKKPDIKLDVNADKIDVDSLMSLAGGQEGKTEEKPEEKPVETEAKPELPELKASGRITIGEARYETYMVRDLVLNYSYIDGIVTANPFSVRLIAEGDPSADGQVDGNLRVDIEKEEITGLVNLKQFKASTGDINTVTSGTVKLDKNLITVKLQSTVNEGIVKVSGSVSDYLKKPDIKLDIDADRIDVAGLIPVAEGQEGRAEAKPAKTEEKAELPDLKASGRITVGEARYETYMVKNLAVNYSYIDGIVSAKPFSVRVIAEGDPSADGQVDGNLRVDIEKEEITGIVNLKQFKASTGNIKTATSGTVKLDKKIISVKLQSTVNKDVVNISGSVKNYIERPDIRIDISAKKLDIEGLMPPEAEKEEVPAKETVKKDAKAPELKASGRITVGEAAYKTVKVRDFVLNFGYVDGAISVKPLSMRFISEEKIKAKGSMKADMSVIYNPMQPVETVKNTLKGTAMVETGKGTIEHTKTSKAIAEKIGLKDFETIGFDVTKFDFNVKDRIINLVGVMNSKDLKLDPKGHVDMDTNMDIKTSIKLSPKRSAKLGTFTNYFKDKQGWATVPLKIKGTFDAPSVSIDKKLVEKMVKKQVKKEMKKTIKRETEKKLKKILPKKLKDKKTEDVIKDIFKRF